MSYIRDMVVFCNAVFVMQITKRQANEITSLDLNFLLHRLSHLYEGWS